MQEHGSESTTATAEQEADPLLATFRRYDLTGSGNLSKYEVKEMMVALGWGPPDRRVQSPRLLCLAPVVVPAIHRRTVDG